MKLFYKDRKYWFLLLLPFVLGIFYFDVLLAVLFTVLLCWLLLSVLFPQYLPYLLVFFYPCIGWDWSYPVATDSILYNFVGKNIELPLFDIVAIFVLLGYLANVFWRYYYHGDKKWKIKFPALFPFLMLIVVAILALANSNVWYWQSVKYILRPIAFSYLAIVIPLYNLVKDKKQYYYLLWLMLFLGIIAMVMGGISVLGIFEHIHRAHPLRIFGYPLWGLNQNLLAEILLAVVPFSIILYLWQKKVIIKNSILLGILGMLLITLLTFSRTAWLGIILAIILSVILLWSEKKLFFLKWGTLLIILLLPLSVFMWSYSFDSYTAQSSNWGRWEMTEFAYFLWQKEPMIGNGAGTYYYRLDETPMYYEHLGQPFDAHGFMQKIGSELGLLGLLSYIFLIFLLGWPLWRIYKTVKYEKDKIIIVMAGLVVIIMSFYQLFNTNYFSSKLWLPLTLAIILSKFYNKKTHRLDIN